MATKQQLVKLRSVITDNLRVQRSGDPIDYVNVGTALADAGSKQNHVIFARRGCGKTLLLHHSSRNLPETTKCIYLNCEDFKRHTFPNVLIEILLALFREMDANISGWFGKKARSKQIIGSILSRLSNLQKVSDSLQEDIKTTVSTARFRSAEAAGGSSRVSAKGGLSSQRLETAETTFQLHKEKLQDLDNWLPELKSNVRSFFDISANVKSIYIQVDDLYHLKRADQAFVVDYIHRLCKDLPLYFKIATLRHATTLYLNRDGQPIGAQERHDYQPIGIDYTFHDFKKTKKQNWQILQEFARKAGLEDGDLATLFKGEGFDRLVMAGGGVPRDVLSLFLEVLSTVQSDGDGRIGKDDIRQLSRSNFERRIEDLKQDSHDEEQHDLLRGIYTLREFCLERKTNLFAVQERDLQKNNNLRSLFNRLLDYRIIHSCATALTHKSHQGGTFQAFAIDIGCYAHFRKLNKRFNEVDVSAIGAKEKMRSCPVLDIGEFDQIFSSAPDNIEATLLVDPHPAELDEAS